MSVSDDAGKNKTKKECRAWTPGDKKMHKCGYCQMATFATENNSEVITISRGYNQEALYVCLDCLEAMGLDETASIEDIDAVWASGFEF